MVRCCRPRRRPLLRTTRLTLPFENYPRPRRRLPVRWVWASWTLVITTASVAVALRRDRLRFAAAATTASVLPTVRIDVTVKTAVVTTTVITIITTLTRQAPVSSPTLREPMVITAVP